MSFSFLTPAVLGAMVLVPLLLAIPLYGRARGALTAQFWAGLILRAVIFSAVVLGLAGAQLVLPVNDTTVIFVVDHSDSVTSGEQQRAENFIREALKTMRAGDRAGVVVFGENALVERLASPETTLAFISSVPRTAHTNLATALRLALALLSDDANKRVVILSDGLENAGRAQEVAELASARRVQLDFVVLQSPRGANEMALDALEAPASVRKGQQFEITAAISSTTGGSAILRLFGDGKLLATQTVKVQVGMTRVGLNVKAEDAGFKRYTAELEATSNEGAPADTLKQNNTAAAFTVVIGPPRVLVVENVADEANNLVNALDSAQVITERATPAAMPVELAALANYDAVFLVNVPARALPDRAIVNLPGYVRDLGRGLVMIGGADAYGAGGYLRSEIEQALPVDMDVPARQQQASLAIAFVIDKSGSMGESEAGGSLSKVEIAKNAVMQSTRALGKNDLVGVLLFDSNVYWAMRMQKFTDASVMQEKVGSAFADGGTDIVAGVAEAVNALKGLPAKYKHVLLLTDGWSNSNQYDALLDEMNKEHITLSVVAAGADSAPILASLAQKGGGRYFAAPTMAQVPEIFFQETVRATGQYIIEEPFQPIPASTTPILNGLDVTRLPILRGYNGTTPKATARMSLVSARGDPLLATWQYGLGRSAAWTSDLKGQWATDWVAWDGFNTFVAQLANWVLPQASDAGLQTEFVTDGEQTSLRVISTEPNGRPRDGLETSAQIVAPDGTAQTLVLNPSAQGTYSAPVYGTADGLAEMPGVYLARITQRDAGGNSVASATSGLVVPYSPEYKSNPNADAGAMLLSNLGDTTNGRELDAPAQAFEPFALPAARTEPIWEYLLLAAALLFPLDVAARRLKFARSDLERLKRRLGILTPTVAPATRAFEGLFAARERAETRTRVARATPTPPAKLQETREARDSERIVREKEGAAQNRAAQAEPGGDEEMTARLKRARDRARTR